MWVVATAPFGDLRAVTADRVCIGSRASKKSKTAALWLIYAIMRYRGSNALVVRKVFRTIKDSVFSELKWAIKHMGVSAAWKVQYSPLELTFTNKYGEKQKIYFRGLDDPLKITSITVQHGALCFGLIEEAYEILNQADFDMLDESIRGELPPGLFKQWTLILNPWSDKHWIKARFFDQPPNPDVLAIQTNYSCNEWLDDADRQLFENMKINNPTRYQVAGLGNWGIVDGLIYENWREERFSLMELKRDPRVKPLFGLDYGYTADPTALFCALIIPDKQVKTIWVFDELYKKGLSNEAIHKEIVRMGHAKEKITADSAEPKSNARLKELGLNIIPARKGPDSVRHGIDFLQDFKIIVHPRCVNFLTEINSYTWAKDKFGKTLNKPVDDNNHLMDAMRYAMEQYSKRKHISFK